MFDFAFLLAKLVGIVLVIIALLAIGVLIYAKRTPTMQPAPIPKAKAERMLRVGYWLIAAAVVGFFCLLVRVA